MRARQALTLAEVIVVGSVSLAMVLAVWMIYDAALRVQRNVALKADVDREVFAAVRHVDWSLKTSRVLQPGQWWNPQPVQSIQLQPLQLQPDGSPLLTVQGFPQWGTPYNVSFQNGELDRITDQTRRLANLGANGSGHFLRKSQGMLEMEVKVQKVDERGQIQSQDLTFEFRLFNQ